MRLSFSIFLLLLISAFSLAQTAPTTADEFKRVRLRAQSLSNSIYPYVQRTVTRISEGDKSVVTYTEITEAEALGVYRITREKRSGNKTVTSYQLVVGLRNIFCSDDGINWTKPTRGGCDYDAAPAPPLTISNGLGRYYVTKNPKAITETTRYVEIAPFQDVFPGGTIKPKTTSFTVDPDGYLTNLETSFPTHNRTTTWTRNVNFAPIKGPLIN